MEVFFLWLLFWALLAFFPANVAAGKGRAKGVWWLYGFLLWPIAMIHALALEKSPQQMEERAALQAVAAGNLKCPSCAEWIKREAKVCRFCGRDVEPNPTATPVAPTAADDR